MPCSPRFWLTTEGREICNKIFMTCIRVSICYCDDLFIKALYENEGHRKTSAPNESARNEGGDLIVDIL